MQMLLPLAAPVLLLLGHARALATSSGSLLSASLLCFCVALGAISSKPCPLNIMMHLIQGSF